MNEWAVSASKSLLITFLPDYCHLMLQWGASPVTPLRGVSQSSMACFGLSTVSKMSKLLKNSCAWQTNQSTNIYIHNISTICNRSREKNSRSPKHILVTKTILKVKINFSILKSFKKTYCTIQHSQTVFTSQNTYTLLLSIYLQLYVVPSVRRDIRALKMKTLNDKMQNAEIIWGNIYLHPDKHLIKADQLCPNPSPLIPTTPYLILES